MTLLRPITTPSASKHLQCDSTIFRPTTRLHPALHLEYHTSRVMDPKPQSPAPSSTGLGDLRCHILRCRVTRSRLERANYYFHVSISFYIRSTFLPPRVCRFQISHSDLPKSRNPDLLLIYEPPIFPPSHLAFLDLLICICVFLSVHEHTIGGIL